MMIDDWDDEPGSPHPFPYAGVIFCIVIVIACLLWPLFLRAGVREQLYVADAESRAQAANRRDLPNDFESAGAGQVAGTAPIEMTVYTMDGCVPCQQMKSWVGNGDDKYRLTWSTGQPPEGIPNLRPVTVWTSPQGRVTYRVGASRMADLIRCYESDLPKAAVGAAPLHIRSQIVDGLDRFRQYAGESVSLKWDRTGKQSFDLLHAGIDWSAESLFGQSGRMEISAPGSPLLVKQAGFGYRVQGDDIAVDLDPIILTGLARRLGPQTNAVGAAEPVKMDPMTVLTILQVLRGIWLALHPTCDLELGGNVACDLKLTGDVLTVKFSECPRLRITAYWQWLLSVDTVIVSPDKIRVEFANQPGSMFPIRSREWAVSDGRDFTVNAMPPDEQSESVDSLATYGAAPNADGTYDDPHDDPQWHATRRQTAIKIPSCQVAGCTDPPVGDAIHHGISAKYCVLAGHYELAVADGPGQKFYRLCERHHGPIGHGIGNGGAWTKFNTDIDADIAAGRWNSRGKSEWPFANDAEAVVWVKSRIKQAKSHDAKSHSKTVQAP